MNAAGADKAVTRRVLIADDEPNIVTAIAYLLQRSGYEVRSAADGEQALALLESYRPDVVLLDVMMPVKTGFEVCRCMREHAQWRDIKIIMLSAKGREAEMCMGLSLGADLYISKPFSTQELVEKIDGMFEESANPGGGQPDA